MRMRNIEKQLLKGYCVTGFRYGGQKQMLNISLTLETMNIWDFRFV